MLTATTTCAPVIRPTCDLIQREFNIDWTKVTWSDLRKPLYSGLAAVLYLMQRTGSNTTAIPASLEGQGDFWSHYYHFGTPVRNFSVAAEATHYSKRACHFSRSGQIVVVVVVVAMVVVVMMVTRVLVLVVIKWYELAASFLLFDF